MKMDETSLSSKSASVNSNVEIYCLLLMLLILGVGSESTLYRVFLNSYGHCGHDKTFEVRPNQGYIVRADVSPNTDTKIFRDCETNFYSKEDNGKLCVIQDGKVSEIGDLNAELLVHDGYDTEESPMIFSLSHLKGGWIKREHCTKSPYLNVYMRKIDKNGNVDIRKIYLNLKVLDIESRDRKLYLDEMYCNMSYQLQNSLVSVYNRAHQRPGGSLRNLTHVCSLQIEKEKNDNRSVCFVYVPPGQVSCGSQWSMSISSESQNLFYKLQCQDEKSRQLHAWCGNNKTHSLTVTFQRGDNSTQDLSSEVPEMFRYIFADHEGTPESLLEKVKREFQISSHDGSLDIGWIICIVLVFILLLSAIFLIYRKRSILPCVHYKAVHNPGNSVSV